jgi:hypothetical protein
MEFIAFDWCGWNEQQGRFTHMPSGKTLVCQQWMRQRDWDDAQMKWFQELSPELVVHKCLTGAYRETGETMGTVREIVARLEARLVSA